MRISNLWYVHTNEFAKYEGEENIYDILIGGNWSREVYEELLISQEELNEDGDRSHIIVSIENGEITQVFISDGYAGGIEIELAEKELDHVLNFIDNNGIMKDGKILKFS